MKDGLSGDAIDHKIGNEIPIHVEKIGDVFVVGEPSFQNWAPDNNEFG